MLPTPSPLRPTRGELAWLFGPFIAALLVVGLVYLGGGSGAVRRYAFLVGWPFFALAFLGSLRAPRRGGAPAPAALTVARLRGRPALAAPPAYRVMCPRLAALLPYPIMGLGVPGVSPVLAAIVAGIGLLAAARLACGVPAVALTPEGVVRGYPMRRTLAWDGFESARLRKAGVRAALDIGAAGRRGRWSRLPEVTTGVNLVYLMDVMRYYADHPEQRATIGAAGVQERVYAVLAAERAGTDDPPAPWSVHSGSSTPAGKPR
ncbi:MAG TPA: hypothetical protein VGP31_01930 [Planosporangium sp.]|nr:hypothetical protein [Planosporangium sp.]